MAMTSSAVQYTGEGLEEAGRETVHELANSIATSIHILCKSIACHRLHERKLPTGGEGWLKGWHRGKADGLAHAVRVLCCDLHDAREIARRGN